ncbi:MAG: hypothetical protein WCI02_19145, partial [Planctomycetota bacterium]
MSCDPAAWKSIRRPGRLIWLEGQMQGDWESICVLLRFGTPLRHTSDPKRAATEMQAYGTTQPRPHPPPKRPLKANKPDMHQSKSTYVPLYPPAPRPHGPSTPSALVSPSFPGAPRSQAPAWE